jgi:hypothetical protein
MMKNFHELVNEYLRKPEFTELMRRLGALGDGKQDQSESSIFAIWLFLVFCKLQRKCKQHVLIFIVVPVSNTYLSSHLLMVGCVPIANHLQIYRLG